MMNLPPQIQQAMLRDPRFAMALQAQQTGSSTAPVGSWGEGLARMLQAPVGAMQGRRVANDYQGQADTYQKALSEGLAKYGAGDSQGAMTAMGQSPYALETGTQLAMQDATTRRQSEILATRLAAQGEQADQRFEQQNQRDEANRAAREAEREKDRVARAELENQRTEAMMARLSGQGEPSAVQEWKFYNSLPTDEAKREYLLVKRNNPYLNLGGEMTQPDPLAPGQATGSFPKTLPPEQRPETKAAQVVATANAEADVKRDLQSMGTEELLGEAEAILSGKSGDTPTGSGLGSIVDSAAGFVGISTSGAEQADRLKAIGGALVSKVPRMEGPQSDKDVALYKQSAGDVGNSSLPIARRIAALATVRRIMTQYNQPQPVESFAPNNERLRFNPVTGELE